MKILTKKQILLLHNELISEFGGIAGIRDEGLLDSAINAPFQSFGGEELYPTLLEKAARLGYGIISNHPFFDGNKRTGTHVMLVLLNINGVYLNYDDIDLINIILSVASGNMTKNQLLLWIQNHIE